MPTLTRTFAIHKVGIIQSVGELPAFEAFDIANHIAVYGTLYTRPYIVNVVIT
jgi:hypothetical protein